MARQERANLGLHEHVVREVKKLCLNKDQKIIDFGCGTGALLTRLKESGHTNLAGTDISPPPDEQGITYFAVDFDNGRSTLPSASASLITAVEVIEHVENLGSFLAELRRVCNSDGQILLTTPNVHSLEAKVRLLLNGHLKQFDHLGDPTHITPIFLFPFERLASRYGLRIKKYWGFPIDGYSPTSRKPLRILARLAKTFGARGDPSGDILCILLEPLSAKSDEAEPEKAKQLTAHYRNTSEK